MSKLEQKEHSLEEKRIRLAQELDDVGSALEWARDSNEMDEHRLQNCDPCSKLAAKLRVSIAAGNVAIESCELRREAIRNEWLAELEAK